MKMQPRFKYIYTPVDELEDTLNEYALDNWFLFSAQFVNDISMAHVILVTMPNPDTVSMVTTETREEYPPPDVCTCNNDAPHVHIMSAPVSLVHSDEKRNYN